MILLGLALLVLTLHPPGDILSQPLWHDEAWVAVTTKARFSDLVWVTSTAPLGFTILLWLIPWPAPESLRLMPLAFAVGTSLASYVLVKSVIPYQGLSARVVASLGGVVAAIAPTSLMRETLKQFTADAFVTVVILIFAIQVEKNQSTRALIRLAAVTSVGAVVSSASVFMSLSALAGLLVTSLYQKHWRIVWQRGLTALGVGTILVVYLFIFVSRNIRESVYQYWVADYLNGSLITIAMDVWDRIISTPGVGWGILWIPLFLLGLESLVRWGYPASAAGLGLLWMQMIILGVLDLYPFLDLRTSHFILLVSSVITLLGAIRLVGLFSRRDRKFGPALSVALAGVFVISAIPYLGRVWIPNQSVRAQASYVQDRIDDADVVVASKGAINGLGYYWHSDSIKFERQTDPRVLENFALDIPGVVGVLGRSASDISHALDTALEKTSKSGGRVWIVRSHVLGPERENWEEVLKQKQVDPLTVQIGSESLLVLNKTSSVRELDGATAASQR